LPADLMAEAAGARPGAAGEQDGSKSESPSGHGFVLKVKKPGELAKTVLEVIKAGGVVLAIALGAMNSASKEEVATVDKVEEKVSNIERRVDGKSDQKGASSDGESLSERVTKLEDQVRPMVKNRCPRDQFLAQVFDRLGAHGIEVQRCPDPSPIEAEPAVGLPGRVNPRREWVIETPMPAP
jgi:hypothetical protein